VNGIPRPAPDDATLADLNFAEMCRVATRNAGGRLLEVDGVLLWAGAHPSPGLVNGLIRTRGTEPPAGEVLDVAATWFGEIEHGYSLHVRVGRDEDLETAALVRGFAPFLELPVMVHDGPPPEIVMPAGHTIGRVEDEGDIRDLVEAVAEPLELLEEVASAFARPESALSPFTAAVVARDAGGRPVAGAWTTVSHGVAGLGFVGTLSRSRGLGLGTAVTAGAMRLGFEMGATMAALQASPAGLPVYARMGFRRVGAYRLLADPVSAKHFTH
jgi:hypothetical protein